LVANHSTRGIGVSIIFDEIILTPPSYKNICVGTTSTYILVKRNPIRDGSKKISKWGQYYIIKIYKRVSDKYLYKFCL